MSSEQLQGLLIRTRASGKSLNQQIYTAGVLLNMPVTFANHRMSIPLSGQDNKTILRRHHRASTLATQARPELNLAFISCHLNSKLIPSKQTACPSRPGRSNGSSRAPTRASTASSTRTGPSPPVGDNDVLVRLRGASLNYRDLLMPRVRT